MEARVIEPAMKAEKRGDRRACAVYFSDFDVHIGKRHVLSRVKRGRKVIPHSLNARRKPPPPRMHSECALVHASYLDIGRAGI